MTFSSCLTERDSSLVLDASVILNLLATGYAHSILQAVKIPIIVTSNAIWDLESGAENNQTEPKQLQKLIHNEILKEEELSNIELKYFFELVSGPTTASLGDGEAATLALAHCRGLTAVIDEKKATKISTDRFEELRLVTTVDILAYEPVRSLLGDETLAIATFKALKDARMRVKETQFDWIQGLIGAENLRYCPSLKKLITRKPAK